MLVTAQMYRFSKRFFDIVVAAIGLVLLFPLILMVASLVRINLGSPIIYRQTRPGIHGEPFEILKFRSMLHQTGSESGTLSNEQRLTPFGKVLRSLSLDELPELWNILKGDMSIVGPRPLLMDYLALYDSKQARRHEVQPGLTGWSQVNGRNALSWDEKFELDIWYVDHASFWLDLKIILMTVSKVLRREGISHPGDVAMPRFQGSSSRHAPSVSVEGEE